MEIGVQVPSGTLFARAPTQDEADPSVPCRVPFASAGHWRALVAVTHPPWGCGGSTPSRRTFDRPTVRPCDPFQQKPEDGSPGRLAYVGRAERDYAGTYVSHNRVLVHAIDGEARRSGGRGPAKNGVPRPRRKGVRVEAILIDQTEIGHATCQVRPGNGNLPDETEPSDRGAPPRRPPTSVALGPTDFSERDDPLWLPRFTAASTRDAPQSTQDGLHPSNA